MAAAMGNLNIRRNPSDRDASCTRNPNRVALDLNPTFYNEKPEATRFRFVTLPFRAVCCLLASGCPLASRQQSLFDKCLLFYVQSRTPDYGRKDSPKHVELFQNKINLRHWCIWLVLL